MCLASVRLIVDGSLETFFEQHSILVSYSLPLGEGTGSHARELGS